MKSSSAPLPRRGPKLHPADWVVKASAVDDVLGEVDKLLRQRRQRRRRIAAASATAAICLILSLSLIPYLRDTATVATLAAHRRTLALSDGSRAELSARTSVQTDFRYGRRIVQL